MNDKGLVERLELAANDAIHDDAANAIRAAILEIARLDAENFRLAAGSCDVEGGKIGDEHGHFRCSLQSRIEALEAALRNIQTLAKKRQAEGGPDGNLKAIEGFAKQALESKP